MQTQESVDRQKAEHQIQRWQELLKEAAQLMRDLHAKGFECTLQKIFVDEKPYIRSRINYNVSRVKRIEDDKPRNK